MKYFFWLSLIFWGLSSSSFAQDYIDQYHQFEEGETHYLLADRVNLRQAPDSDAKIVANLAIGSEVQVVEKSPKTLKINGFESAWYKVKAAEKEGYIWGGLIADYTIKLEDTYFLFGLINVKQDKEGEHLKAQLRVCQKGKEVAKVEFEQIGGLDILHKLSLKGNQGIEGIEQIISIEVSQPACGGIQGETVIFWDGDALYHIQNFYSGGDALAFTYEYFIYPDHEEGIENRIVEVKREVERTEDDSELIYEHIEKTYFSWTGSKLQKLQ